MPSGNDVRVVAAVVAANASRVTPFAGTTSAESPRSCAPVSHARIVGPDTHTSADEAPRGTPEGDQPRPPASTGRSDRSTWRWVSDSTRSRVQLSHVRMTPSPSKPRRMVGPSTPGPRPARRRVKDGGVSLDRF